MEISKAQRAALQTINDNPDNVIAWQRLEGLKMLRINGNTENSIHRAGLATTREVQLARPVYFRHQGDTHTVTKVEVWDLTDKGREALGVNEATKATAGRVADGQERFHDALRDAIGLKW
jgi:hypothetical protein